MKTWHDILRADGNVFTEVITVILVHSLIFYIFWERLKLKIWFALLLSNIKDNSQFFTISIALENIESSQNRKMGRRFFDTKITIRIFGSFWLCKLLIRVNMKNEQWFLLYDREPLNSFKCPLIIIHHFWLYLLP